MLGSAIFGLFAMVFLTFSAAVRVRVRTPVRTPTRLFSDHVVVVVGGGAAGYFSAVECATRLKQQSVSSKVYVLEAGRSVLSKVLISGGGRCNVMHNPDKPPSEISKGYPRGSRELLGPLTARFGPKETKEWFTKRGVTLKTERDGRVFPITDKSSTITDTLERAARDAAVDVKTGVKVTSVQISVIRRFKVTYQASAGEAGADSAATESGVAGAALAGLKSKRSSLYSGLDATEPNTTSSAPLGRQKETHEIECDSVIMASGSSRLGYEIVRSLGHTMMDPLPSLFSFKIKDPELTALSGVSCKNCKVRLLSPTPATTTTTTTTTTAATPTASAATIKPKTSPAAAAGLIQRGPLLITKQGVSGPAVLKLSAFGARILSEVKYRCGIEVSWLGDLSTTAVVAHLTAAKSEHANKLVSKFFPQLSPELLIDMRSQFPDSSTTGGSSGGSGASMRVSEDDFEDLRKYGATDSSDSFSGAERASTSAGTPKRGGAGSGGSGGGGGQPSAVEAAEDAVISRRLWLYLLTRAGLGDPQLKWRQMTAPMIGRLATELTACRFETDGRGLYRDEFVTCGGVKLSEVNFKTMESKLQPGLYLAGEVLDVDGITGGYNFQSAWTTGYIAGRSCAEGLLQKGNDAAMQ